MPAGEGILHQIKVRLVGSDELSSVLKKASGSVENFKKASEQMKSAGMKMMGVGAALTGVGVMAGHAFTETQAAMRPLKALLIGTAGDIETRYATAMKAARDWTSKHVNSMQDWGQAAVPMMKILKDVNQTVDGTGIALKLTTATSSDAAQASLVLASSYENFGDKTKDMHTAMTQLGDQITATMQAFNVVDLTQFQQGFRKSGLAAKNLGVDTAQVFAVLGQFNNLQLPGREVGASFTQMALKMRDASKQLGFGLAQNASGGLDLIGTLGLLRNKFGESSAWSDQFQEKLKKAFGDQVFEKLSYLVDNLEGVRTGLGRITNSAGLVDKVSKSIDEGLGGSIRILKNNLGNLLDAVFEPMAPVVRQVAVRLGEAVNGFRLFAEEHPRLVKIAGTIGLIAGSVMLLGGGALYLAGTFTGSIASILKMTGAISKAGGVLTVLKTGILAVGRALLSLFLNPVGLVILGVVALGAGIYLLYKHSETFRNMVARVGEVLSATFKPALISIAYGVGYFVGTLMKGWQIVSDYTAEVWPLVSTYLVGFGKVVYAYLVPAIAFLKGYLVFAWDVIKTVTVASWEFVKLTIATVFNMIKNIVFIGWSIVSGIFKASMQILTGDWAGAWETIKQMFVNVWEGIKGYFGAVFGWFSGLGTIFYDAGVGLMTAFKDGIMAAWESLKGGVMNVLGWIRDLLPGSDAKRGPLSDLTASGRAFFPTFTKGLVQESDAPVRGVETALKDVTLAPGSIEMPAPRPRYESAPASGGSSLVVERGAIIINVNGTNEAVDDLETRLEELFARLNRRWGAAYAG